MIIGFILFFLLVLLSDIYLCISVGSLWAGLLISLPTLVLIVSFVAASRGFYHNTFMRLIFGLVLLFALPKLIVAVFLLIGLWKIGLTLALFLVLFVSYGFFFGWRQIVVRNAVCESELLPREFEGYRILQLSDLHIGTFL